MPLRTHRIRRRHQIQITHQPLRFPRLPADFAGLRLAQLTDIHHGLYTRLEEVERAVELANGLDPDLVALTGDFVSHSANFIAPMARALGRLRARLGVFAVLGNHDFRVDADSISQALEEQGIAVLRNRHVRLARNGSAVVVAGVDDVDYWAHDLERALLGVIPKTFTILLCHNPVVLPAAAAHGIDLVLAGHTHGGQVDFPRVRSFLDRRGLRLPARLRHGLEQLGETQMYVSRGIGTVVFPFRLRCPAEIPVLRLETSNGQGG
ncbi:MAG: metallophosphoesterase [Acidobacteria bacterium]|nr:metallophosphoesterase [Acidobacteriota bacterium]